MTQDEQRQVNAMLAFLERQIGNLAREGANASMLAESFAIKCKELEAEIAKLKTPADNVVPMKGDAA